MTCEICGGNDLVKQDGVFVCQSCGSKYSVEEIRKMMGVASGDAPSKKTNNVDINNFLTLARNALENDKEAEAERYANKALEQDVKCAEAWFLKGKAVGWQTTGGKNRLSDATSAFIKALNYAPSADREKLEGEVVDSFGALLIAILNLHAGFFSADSSSATEEHYNGLCNTLSEGIHLLNKLCIETGLRYPREVLHAKIAQVLNSASCDALTKMIEKYGNPPKISGGSNNLLTFIKAADRCIWLEKTAISYERSVAGNLSTFIDNCIFIQDCVCNASTYDGTSLTADAVSARKDECKEFEKLKDFLENESPAAQIARKATEKLNHYLYWKNHGAEKAALEEERDGLYEKIEELEEEQETCPEAKALAKTQNLIESTTLRMNSLGLFKGKEKKQLQANIDELRAKLPDLRTSSAEAVSRLEAEANKLRERIDEIDAYLENGGKADLESLPLDLTGVIADGAYTVNANGFIDRINRGFHTGGLNGLHNPMNGTMDQNAVTLYCADVPFSAPDGDSFQDKLMTLIQESIFSLYLCARSGNGRLDAVMVFGDRLYNTERPEHLSESIKNTVLVFRSLFPELTVKELIEKLSDLCSDEGTRTFYRNETASVEYIIDGKNSYGYFVVR